MFVLFVCMYACMFVCLFYVCLLFVVCLEFWIGFVHVVVVVDDDYYYFVLSVCVLSAENTQYTQKRKRGKEEPTRFEGLSSFTK